MYLESPDTREKKLKHIAAKNQVPKGCCPDKWIGFQRKCYYFSEKEANWTSSRDNCATEDAFLTKIDTQQEMNFLRRYKGNSDHWIGLTMINNQTGNWVDGTKFNNWFKVRGREECAYLNDDGAATARCYPERKWICRKNDTLV
ncbi:C-type lectin domain family 2 member B [Carlito syrichta]|uniref:C-type lectin domain family 2 member B n=1 Tax=Carlito syrichta TaxID=1868482 RepID=A0A1U7SHE4_CARSF|nr:C-type lectin domain family 2 member B [Carlito syrichta]